MMMSYKQYVIGLDIGTTSAKAVLFTLGGKVVAEAEKPYDISRPQPLWAEQDPLSVEAGCLEVLKQVMEMGQVRPEALCSVGISSAMHSLICVNEEGAPLSPSIIWLMAEVMSKQRESKTLILLSIFERALLFTLCLP